VLIRSGEALAIDWSRNMLHSGFNTLHRSVIRRQTLFAARITWTLFRSNLFWTIRMCIFSQPVNSVNATRIFARPTGTGSQFLAYQMSYNSPSENAIILPLPVRTSAREDGVRFIDLEGYQSLFDDLSEGFPYTAPAVSIGCSAPPECDSMLEVFKVGNYIASFVPTLEGFSRLDPRFSLPQTTWEKVPQYLEFGFAVFQLAQGNLTPHPMALEFQTDSQNIYFPTMHIHDGDVHDMEEFDHVLYMQHAGLDSSVYQYMNSNVPDKSTGLVRSKHVARRFCNTERTRGIVDGKLLVHKKTIFGEKPNHDTEIFTSGDASRPSFNARPLLAYTPWLFVAAGIAWFVRRRDRISRMENSENAE